MAVVDDSLDYGHQALGGEGILTITERCVFIDAMTYQVTLVWRAGEAAWDADEQAIVFKNPWDDPAMDPLVLRNGMTIAVGGPGTWPDDDPALPAERWLQRPDPSCPADTFNVHSVRIIAAAP